MVTPFGGTGRDGGGGHRLLLAAGVAGILLTLSACDALEDGGTSDGADGTAAQDGSGQPDAVGDALVATLAAPEEATVVTGSAAQRALRTTAALFATAPVVVVAAPDEQLRAASAAVALGVPVLVDGAGTAEEVERLGAEVALVLGPVDDPGIDVVVPQDDEELARLLGVGAAAVTVDAADATARIAALDPAAPELLVPGAAAAPAPEDSASTTADATDATSAPEPGPAPLDSDRDELPETAAPQPQGATVVLTTGSDDDLAALGTARAAGATVVVAEDGDPRSSTESVEAMAGSAPTAVLGLGEEFGDTETLAWRSRTAATGEELPGGGQLALPGKTYVALYGTPVTSALGVLGEQPIEETITRAEEFAAAYQPLTDEPVVPTLEIIVTVASEGAGPDGNYSNELPLDDIRPLVDLAGEHGVYVVLDLQPGRTDYVTQAKLYEELLVRPYVGLALDPEWRLRPDQVHMTEIGQVSVSEVDEVVTYLADLTRENDLPQKILVLHQFQTRMIPDVNEVDQSRSEVAVLIHADGQGPQPSKQDTWRTLRANAPDVEHWGWKNFYDEDVPGPLTPEETMSLVDPVPDFISYQ
ncbi:MULTISPECIES: hypothetical protein [unclassified Ornithinimicrobium]|uniref:hypothetical protein n=1 Tax=unclassified Ornithinimicrobium TaxID=2615080 RepID=UPI0038549046